MKVKSNLEGTENSGLEFDVVRIQNHVGQASHMLRALANPQRLRILCLLVAGELSVGQINEQVTLSQSALSQHLAILRQQSVVTTRREAQTIYYALTGGPAQAILETLYTVYCSTPNTPANTHD